MYNVNEKYSISEEEKYIIPVYGSFKLNMCMPM